MSNEKGENSEKEVRFTLSDITIHHPDGDIRFEAVPAQVDVPRELFPQVFILVENVNQDLKNGIGIGIEDFIAVSTDLEQLKAAYPEDYDYEIYGYIPEKHGSVGGFFDIRTVCKRIPGQWVEVEGEYWKL